MVSDGLIEELRFKGEGSDLDYKAERYLFANGTDLEKSEMLKDILALANAHRDGTAYILFGFKENVPHPAEVVGLNQDAIDDSRLQQFVNSKVEPKLEFRYEERIFEDLHIAILSIPKQPRPFYLKKEYGKVLKSTVYVRRGSATAIAEPNEVAMMGAANNAKGQVDATVSFQTLENQQLPAVFEKEFLRFPHDLPDLRQSNTVWQISTFAHNRDYFREKAAYHAAWAQILGLRLLVRNNSEFSLGDAHLEVTATTSDNASISMVKYDDMPEMPEETAFPIVSPRYALLNQQVRIDTASGVPVAHIALGAIRPSQAIRVEDDLAIMPSCPGNYLLQARLFANEISTPLVIEHRFEVTGKVTNVPHKEFFDFWEKLGDDDE